MPVLPTALPATTQSEAATSHSIAAGLTGSFRAAISGTIEAKHHHIGKRAAGLSQVPALARANAAMPMRTILRSSGRKNDPSNTLAPFIHLIAQQYSFHPVRLIEQLQDRLAFPRRLGYPVTSKTSTLRREPRLAIKPAETYLEEGVDGLALITPLIEKRRQIFIAVVLASALVGGLTAILPRKYTAEMTLTPVTNSRSSPALGGLAAIAGATLQTGYQLTPARMVELLTSRAVLAGVGQSTLRPGSTETVIDAAVGETGRFSDTEQIARHLRKITTVGANKETGTISLAVTHKDSALARTIASRVVDSASHIFVRTSRAQAQQLRVAQDARVENAAAQLASAEDRLRDFSFGNRATPSFSSAGLERERLGRAIRFAEQAYTQAMTEREAAFARELEATPTVVVQDPLPATLPKVRKRLVAKTIIAAVSSFALMCIWILLVDLTRKRLERSDLESQRFRNAMATLPRLRAGARTS